MKRWLYAYTTVVGNSERFDRRFKQRIRELLRGAPDHEEHPPAADGSFTVQLDARVAGLTATKAVSVATGVARDANGRTVIPLRWHAEPGKHAFPAFEGAIEFYPLSSAMAQVTVVGSYTPPLGPVGVAVDATVLSGVAQRTAQAVADRVAAGLSGDVEDAPAQWPRSARLALRVSDVMTPDPLVLDEDLPLRTAALLLFHQGISGAPVVSVDGGLVGVLSERDLMEKQALPRAGLGRKAAEGDRRRRARSVGEACSRPARVTTPEVTVRAAAREMLGRGIGRLVVVDGSRIAGIVTRHDVLRALIRADAEIQAEVDALLGSLAEPDVRASVVWGEVHLEGAAHLRSRVPHIVRMLENVDGVIAVHGDLAYETDDVLPPPLGMHPLA